MHLSSHRAPKGSRVYAIGDIHGRLDLLDKLLETIARDAKKAPKRRVLVTLGDYVDRGADSAGVIERMVNLHKSPPFDDFELHFLKGNHEQVMEAFLDGEDASLWLPNGGLETLQSYGVRSSPQKIDRLRTEAQASIPKKHRAFLASLELIHREGDYAFVHAGVRPGVSLKRQASDDLMWIRLPFLTAEADFGAKVVHGHSPVVVPDVRPNRIAIDTRAWLSGTLTCLVVQDDECRFLST